MRKENKTVMELRDNRMKLCRGGKFGMAFLAFYFVVGLVCNKKQIEAFKEVAH